MKRLSNSILIFSAAIILTACGGSNSNTGPGALTLAKASESDFNLKTFDSLVRTFSIQTEECLNGGIEIEMGIDNNGNGRLDTSEVDNDRTQTICHGSDGSSGSDGTNGSSSLISITSATTAQTAVAA